MKNSRDMRATRLGRVLVLSLAGFTAGCTTVPSDGGIPVLQGATVRPSPNTHVFDPAAWKAANPNGDVSAAIAEAKQQGYQVKQMNDVWIFTKYDAQKGFTFVRNGISYQAQCYGFGLATVDGPGGDPPRDSGIMDITINSGGNTQAQLNAVCAEPTLRFIGAAIPLEQMGGGYLKFTEHKTITLAGKPEVERHLTDTYEFEINKAESLQP